MDTPVSNSGNVCIVGNHEFLGEWDVRKGFPIGLASGGGSFFAELSFPLSVETIEYKVRMEKIDRRGTFQLVYKTIEWVQSYH